MTPKGIPLADLVSPDLKVTLRGKEYKVKPLDGFGYQLINRMTGQKSAESIETMYRVAARCLMDSMPRDEVFGTDEALGLSPEEITQVVGVASGHIEAVEATVPNDGKAGNPSDEAKETPSSPPDSPRPIHLAS